MEEQYVIVVTNWPYHEYRDMPKRPSWIKRKVDWAGDWLKLTRHPDGADAWFTWHAISGLAVQSPYRGLLLMDGHRIAPMTIQDIADITHVQIEQIKRGLPVLISEIEWVKKVLWTEKPVQNSKQLWSQVYTVAAQANAKKKTSPAENPPLHNNTIHNITRHNITSPNTLNSSLRDSKPRANVSELGEINNYISKGIKEETWEVITKAPKEWQAELVKRKASIQDYVARGMAHRVLATILDVSRASKRPSGVDEAMQRVFYRLRNDKLPNDEHYDEAKRLLASKRESEPGHIKESLGDQDNG